MVTAFFLIFIVNSSTFSIFVVLVFVIFTYSFFILVFIFWLETTFSGMCSWLEVLLTSSSSEACPCLPHLIEKFVFLFLIRAILFIIIKDLFVFGFPLAVLEFLYEFLVFILSGLLLQVVSVKFVLKIVYVRELLNIDLIESFKFSFQSFILILVFRLDIDDTLHPLLGSLIFLSSSLDLVIKFSFIHSQLLHRVFHLLHLASLLINDRADTFFNILLLSVGVKIPRDRIKEL